MSNPKAGEKGEPDRLTHHFEAADVRSAVQWVEKLKVGSILALPPWGSQICQPFDLSHPLDLPHRETLSHVHVCLVGNHHDAAGRKSEARRPRRTGTAHNCFFFWLHLHSSRSPGHHDRRGWKKRSASVAKRMRSWPVAAPRPSLGSEP